VLETNCVIVYRSFESNPGLKSVKIQSVYDLSYVFCVFCSTVKLIFISAPHFFTDYSCYVTLVIAAIIWR